MSDRRPVRPIPAVLLVLLVVSGFVSLPLLAQSSGPTRLLRFPDLHGDRVVFTYAGDLWTASASGGVAARLTTHPGLELFAKFSPDGESIAFTGQYDGDEQVYVMSASGGVPEQLTFYPASGPLAPRWGYDNQVYGWHPDGDRVLFRSMRDGFDLGDTQLFLVPTEGGLPVALPMPVSGGGDLSPDGSRAVYSPVTRDFRHWKRYEGGWAQDLHLFDLESHDTTRITDDVRSERDPMWIDDRIYFSSDRDGKLNLYSYAVGSGAVEQHTTETVWDVRWPSADHPGRRIVYELDGALRIYDLEEDASSELEILVPSDALAKRPTRVSAARNIEDFDVSPNGERVVFTARGDLFTVPVEHGPTRNLTRSAGAHDRQPAWSPDGAHIAFVSDQDGEEEIWLVDQRGSEEPLQLTDGSRGRYHSLLWSPDSKRLAYGNQAGRLFVVDVAGRDVVEIADDPQNFGLEYDWSPHGGHLTYSLGHDNGFRSLWIWSAADGVSRQITDETWNEFSPSFGSAGDYLFYLSDREFGPQLGSFEFDYVANRETYVYALALREDVAHPFPVRSDEVEMEDDGDSEAPDSDEDPDLEAASDEPADGEEPEAGEEDEEDDAIVIDFEGLRSRVARVPLDADNFVGLSAVEGALLFLKTGPGYYGRSSGVENEIRIFDLSEREDKLLVEGLSGFALSASGKKGVTASGGSYQLVDIAKSGDAAAKPISTAGLEMVRDPSEEWGQIFDEVWRRFRDFFYVENMHGVDWEGVKRRYEPQLEHVAHRSDLNYVISEMLGELSVSHAYIAGGDYEIPERPRSALLGARFELDEESGRYRVSRIFEGHNEEPAYRSPLREIGAEVEVGDYVLAINGEELSRTDNPWRKLRFAGGGAVELTVSESPGFDDSKRVLVSPIRDEDNLLYLQWTESQRRIVAEATDGRVGYIHLPDMGAQGIREWIKWFYGQIRKEGLIIDVRSNGGGNVSQMIIERLRRDLLMVDFERNVDYADTYPGTVFTGQLVCLLDEDTASDGDQFAWVFREAGLGPLIGRRSWGGVVGIYGRGPLVDGGSLSVPEAGSANANGDWIIEGHGVDPDIEVELDPKLLLEGRDTQLEKAIEVILERIDVGTGSLPARPSAPDKSL